MFHHILNLLGLNRASKKSKASKQSGFGGPRRLRLEPLEDRRMLATLTVNASFDQDGIIEDGTLTLREAIAYVNGVTPQPLEFAQIDETVDFLGQNDIILFDSILSGATIKLGIDSSGTVIPALYGYIGALKITNSVKIDASSFMINGLPGLTIDASGTNPKFHPVYGYAIDDPEDGSSVFDINLTPAYNTVQEVVLDSLTITGSDSKQLGGGISFSGRSDGATGNAKFTIRDSIIKDNATGGSGGGIFIQSTDGDNEETSVLIENSIISGNTARGGDIEMNHGGGGGIAVYAVGSKVEIVNSTIIGNTDLGQGGGIFIFEKVIQSFKETEVNVIDSTISGNSTNREGGGLAVLLEGTDEESTKALFSLIGSTVSGNSSFVGSTGDNGGGVYICSKWGSTTDILNSTISGNDAGGSQGGAMYLARNPSTNSQQMLVNISNATITNNSAGDGGGLSTDNNPLNVGFILTTLRNTIVSGNLATNTGGTNNIDIPIENSSEYNLIGPSSFLVSSLPGLGNIEDTDNNPDLKPLAYYGGPTQTHLPDATSEAIDVGDPNYDINGSDGNSTTNDVLLYDQRGAPFDRVINGIVDIGAVERRLLTITDVIVSGSTSLHDPFSFDTVDGSGDQLKTVPVGGSDTISIVFSEDLDPASIDKDSLRVLGLTTANLPTVVAASFNYSQTTDTATWQFVGWTIFGDNYLISLTDEVTDVYNNPLDGEWVNPKTSVSDNAGYSGSSVFPSGDGTPGGSFNFIMTLLPGDATLDGVVGSSDLGILLNNFNIPLNHFFVKADFNGDGVVDSDDLPILLINYGTNLQDIFVLADLNGDFDVDGNDLQTITDNLDTAGTYADGDLNGDGWVDALDLALAEIQFDFGVEFDWVA